MRDARAGQATGAVRERTPWVVLDPVVGNPVEFVVDTGYVGGLGVRRSELVGWRMWFVAVGTDTLADGSQVEAHRYKTEVLWLGGRRTVSSGTRR